MATNTKKKVCKEPVRAIRFSEILHLAADQYLKSGYAKDYRRRHHTYSCFAIESAIDDLLTRQDITEREHGVRHFSIGKKIFDGLDNMGHFDAAFEYIGDKKERQAVRYMWLKLAALLAENQGQ